MKKFKPLTLIATAALGVSLVLGAQTQASASNIKLIGENGPISSDVAPYLVKGTVLVPINTIGKLGLKGLNLSWNNTKKLITISYQNEVITVKVNQKYGIKGDKRINLAEPAQIKNGRVMIPLRFVSESLGETVNWDAKSRTVTIGSPKEDSSHNSSELTNQRLNVIQLPLVKLKEQLNVGGLSTMVYYFPVNESSKYFLKLENRIDYYEIKDGKSYQLWSAEVSDEISKNKGLPILPYKIEKEIGSRPVVSGAFVYFKNVGAIGSLTYGVIDKNGVAKQLGEGDSTKGAIVDIPDESKYDQ